VTTRQRIAVIGAGPIGLEAALFASRAGNDVNIYERGQVAENLRRWGHVRLFSPFGLNVSPWGRRALAESSPAAHLPNDPALHTGCEFVESYLLPLSRLPQLAGRVHEGVDVCGISRTKTWKRELIGKPERGGDPFRLLLRDGTGERTAEADVVFDCSGTYRHHNWIGAGGLPAIGETASLDDQDYELPDILGRDRQRFLGRATLVIGSGYSAATAVVSLAKLAETDSATKVVWMTRRHRDEPIARVPDDPLHERDALALRANRLAASGSDPVTWRPGCLIESIERTRPQHGYRVIANDGTNIAVDRVIANVGYRPDRRLYEELQVHECYASQGPMKLAATLLGETSADCLSQAGHGPHTLLNPEPGFFILGAKSYGRDSRFLIKIGIEQIRDVFSLLSSMK